MEPERWDLPITSSLSIPANEIELAGIRASGPGGQNVNKVSSAIHLRFDIGASSLPAKVQERLLSLRDQRISDDGLIIIKARRYRSRERNLADARQRLQTLIRSAMVDAKPRRPTRPTRGSHEKRLAGKTERARTKRLRQRIKPQDV